MKLTNQNTIFCTKCGDKNNSISLYCSNCGSEFIRTKAEYTRGKSVSINNIAKYSDISDIDIDDIEKFVFKNTHYYNEKFNKIKTTGSKITWNWAAFFLNIYWMLYRKMYLQAGAIFLGSILIAQIPYLGAILSFGLSIAIGMYSNALYLNHIQRKLTEVQHLDYEMKESMIIKKGGTNIVIPLIAVGICIVIAFIIIMLFGIAFKSMFY
ncbi:DUF2628 domain-containing protein [Romboutsia hominis]|uniref:DUF2628 domain-containing protein n=1 Tax=Romboutsia hominis TaxID=1507512 RepID=A0A2P2BSJ2_9FIRM|nr:DUF2628 domain-containing protein [Romboutsia hominis]CEI73355.1 Protein of unknown function (DUF2628) [Romboutsia hominis]